MNRLLYDTVELDDAGVRETRDGYLVATARTARTGIQAYTAKELGLEDRDPASVVRVYRPETAVFDEKALASMAWRPMTNDHPPENVTSTNWKDYSTGHCGGDVIRDGDFVRLPLVMMDATAIADWKAGKRELSWGYTGEITLKDGVTPKGEAYDAELSDIRANHIAQCWKARGGESLRIGDQKPEDGAPKVSTKVILVDGFSVEVTDAAERAILNLQGRLETSAAALATANATIGDHVATISARDGEIVVLKKQVEDAAVTPAKLAEMVAGRTALEGVAKKLIGDAAVFTGKSDADIRREAVVKHIGDAAKTLDDAAIGGAFTALAAGAAKIDDATADDPIARLIDSGGTKVDDADKKVAAARQGMLDSYKPEAAAKH